jgi:hypothetical protein
VRFKKRLLTQHRLGKLFGVTASEVGRWLVAIGLKDDGGPTDRARLEGFCRMAACGPGMWQYVWHAGKTAAAFRDAGHVLPAEPPEDLVEPAALAGPFSVCPSDGQHVRNSYGEVVVSATTAANAEAVLRLLNAAHRCGALIRLVGEPPAASEDAAEADEPRNMYCGFMFLDARYSPSERTAAGKEVRAEEKGLSCC